MRNLQINKNYYIHFFLKYAIFTNVFYQNAVIIYNLNPLFHMKNIILLYLLMCSVSLLQAQDLIRFYQKGKVGYKNQKNEIIVNPVYEAGSEFKDGIAIVVADNKRGYINNSGKEFIALQYDDAAMFVNGLACVKFGGKYGYINQKAEWMIQPIYDEAYTFADGLARVQKGGKWGYINLKGDLVIPLKYDFAHNFSMGLAAVSKEGKFGYISANGETVIALQYDAAVSFNKENNAIVSIKGENFLINKSGKILREIEKFEEHEGREDKRK